LDPRVADITSILFSANSIGFTVSLGLQGFLMYLEAYTFRRIMRAMAWVNLFLILGLWVATVYASVFLYSCGILGWAPLFFVLGLVVIITIMLFLLTKIIFELGLYRAWEKSKD